MHHGKALWSQWSVLSTQSYSLGADYGIPSQREGVAVPSMVSELMDRVETSDDEEIAKDAAASVYLGLFPYARPLCCLTDLHCQVAPTRQVTFLALKFGLWAV